MQQKTIGPDKSWRMVYADGKVLMLEQLAGYTTTIHGTFEAQTREECESEAQRLGLELPDQQDAMQG